MRIWQTLFLGFSMHEEVPKEFLEEVLKEICAAGNGVGAQPTTPDTTLGPRSDPFSSALSPEKVGPLPRHDGNCRPASFGQPPVQDQMLRPAKRKAEPASKDQAPAAQKPKTSGSVDLLELESDEELAVKNSFPNWRIFCTTGCFSVNDLGMPGDT